MWPTLFSIHDVILIMTSYQCIIFAVLLLTIRRDKPLTHTLLALFLLQYAVIAMDILVRFSVEFRHILTDYSPNFFYLFSFGYWLEGPLLLWYTRSLIYKNYSLSIKDLWYLLPLFSYVLYDIFSYYSLDSAAKVRFQEAIMGFSEPHFRNYLAIARDLFRFSLGVLCLMELQRFKKHLQNNYSDVERRQMNWLRLLIVGFLVVRTWTLIVVILAMLSMAFGISTNFGLLGLLSTYAIFILVTLLIFYNLRNSLKSDGLDMTSPHPGDHGDDLRDKFKPEQIDILTTYLEREKPYLQPDLTLNKLASLVSISPRTLSNIINRHFHCNFFEFVNLYRIDEAKRLLSDTREASSNILSVMYAAGFNSKTTFNTLFKKRVGITPSQFRKLAIEHHQEKS